MFLALIVFLYGLNQSLAESAQAKPNLLLPVVGKGVKYEVELSQFKVISKTERDPASQSMVKWYGVSLLEMIEDVFKKMGPEKSAGFDLVIIKGEKKSAAIPRSFITKFPLILAFRSDGKGMDGRAPLYSVVPWSSNAKIAQEGLPLGQYFVESIKEIELTNYRESFSKSLFLENRSDPMLVRGEKRFMQTCMGCHTPGEGNRLGSYLDNPHKDLPDFPALKDGDQKALRKYLQLVYNR